MNKVLGFVLLVAIAGNGFLAWELNSRISPTNPELDADLASVRGQRQALKQQASAASTLLDQIYAQSEAMLVQQRQALFRFVTLSYSVAGTPVPKASAADLAEIDQAIARQKAGVEAARADAAKYSGGLILGLIQMRIATAELSVAGLEQHRLTAKYGITLPVPEPPGDQGKSERLAAIEREMEQKKQAISSGEAEAQRYSGGLVLVMVLARVETDKLTLAALEQKALALKYDIGVPALSIDLDNKPPAQPKPPGKVVLDKEAIQ